VLGVTVDLARDLSDYDRAFGLSDQEGIS